MLGILCLVAFMTTEKQQVYVNLKEIISVEDEVSATKIYMTRAGTYYRVSESHEKVVAKLKEAAGVCK